MNNSMNDLMNLISVLCGGYCLYTWFRLVREKRLFENGILLPKDRKPEDCVDEHISASSAQSLAFWDWWFSCLACFRPSMIGATRRFSSSR